MTCIVGIEHAGAVTIGGDAAAVEGLRLTVRTDPKVFFVDDFLIGFEDSFRMGQLLRYRLRVPSQKCDDDFEFMATTFVDAVRKCFTAGGFSRNDDGEESGGSFLVGYGGRLYAIDSDYHVGRARCGFEAIGCGSEFAIGSMASTTGPAENRVRMALTVAATHCAGVVAPFTILTSTETFYE